MTTERVQVAPRIGEFAHPKDVAAQQQQPTSTSALFSVSPQPSLEKTVATQAGRFMSASSEYWLIGIVIVLITVILMLIVYIVKSKNEAKAQQHPPARDDVQVQEIADADAPEDSQSQSQPQPQAAQEKNIPPSSKQQPMSESQQRELLSKPLQLRGGARPQPPPSKPLMVMSGDADVPASGSASADTDEARAEAADAYVEPGREERAEEHTEVTPAAPEEYDRRESDFTPPSASVTAPVTTPSRRGGRRGRPPQQQQQQ